MNANSIDKAASVPFLTIELCLNVSKRLSDAVVYEKETEYGQLNSITSTFENDSSSFRNTTKMVC